jgi:hypothetical protein
MKTGTLKFEVEIKFKFESTYGLVSAVEKPYGPIDFTIENFKALFASLLRNQQPNPIVIHNR